MNLNEAKIAYYTDIITRVLRVEGSDEAVSKIIRVSRGVDNTPLSKNKLITIFEWLVKTASVLLSEEDQKKFLYLTKKKAVRSMSGVTTVTVLTMPYPCPGRCIFRPNDVRMPKSYISSEPGAQRALTNKFDPYMQTFNRLVALHKNGHPTEKIELIVLGGTWTFYPADYRRWFIYQCFRALNDFITVLPPEYLNTEQIPMPVSGSDNPTLSYNYAVALGSKVSQDFSVSVDDFRRTQQINEKAKSRCVGLSLETRPDEITPPTVVEMRELGATKIQMGIQALDDSVLALNKRGHTVAQISDAFRLLRSAGFKIQVHWMPNLYGSNPQMDLEMYLKLFSDDRFKPDEIKIYPCSLIPNTELEAVYKTGKWAPYSDEVLTKLLADFMVNTPRYCRTTCVIRDIPSTEILAGTKKTNLRQDAEHHAEQMNTRIVEIRQREIRDRTFLKNNITLKSTAYYTSVSKEVFLEFTDDADTLIGFLRLCLPNQAGPIGELTGSALIREIHIYGQTLNIGKDSDPAVQHKGYGTKLLKKASDIALSEGYLQLSVISSVGTRDYYRKQEFNDGYLYQHKLLG